jgi:phosphoribosylaminoimidazole-succinocarboxamide synthase
MISVISDNEMVVKKVSIIPIEVVVRNIATGSLTKRLALEDGKELDFTLVEFYYKDDALGDPLINDEHALLLGCVKEKSKLDDLRALGRKVNDTLRPFFDERGLILVDFKLEFGIDSNGDILLADEISPDSCRLWDKETLEKLDKDRFRQDLGSVKAGYEKVLERILG